MVWSSAARTSVSTSMAKGRRGEEVREAFMEPFCQGREGASVCSCNCFVQCNLLNI
jgi:hypothetical protein